MSTNISVHLHKCMDIFQKEKEATVTKEDILKKITKNRTKNVRV